MGSPATSRSTVRIDELIHFTLAAITVIFVVVAVALIWSSSITGGIARRSTPTGTGRSSESWSAASP